MLTARLHRSLAFRTAALLIAGTLPTFGAIRTVTNLNDSGPGSFRQAIQQANTSSGDTINFANGVTGVILLQSALPQITASVTINGPGPASLAIDGQQMYACILSTANSLSISGLTIRKCSSLHGGGVFSLGTLSLTNVDVTLNTARYDGGGIVTEGASTALSNVNITRNSAAIYGGGLFIASGSNSLTNVSVSGNTASDGGGIFLQQFTTLKNVSLIGNTGQVCGGIDFASVTLTATNVSFIGNTADWWGGGLCTMGSQAVLSNATFWGNSAGIAGGAIFNNSALAIHTPSFLVNTTLLNNTAPQGGAIYSVGGTGSKVSLQNTILAGSPSGGNCWGTAFTSTGYNISDDTSCAPFLTAIGDLNNTPAGLAPSPQDNGGPTLTIALQPYSLAINRIPIGTPCPLATDQRGVARPQGGGCDSGAYELAQFSEFDATLKLVSGALGHFNVDATVAFGNPADSFNPAADAITLAIGSWSMTLPAGSVHSIGSGFWAFAGPAGGAVVTIDIQFLADGKYRFSAIGGPIAFLPVISPTTVSLTIGVNSGSATVPFTP